MVRSRVRAGAIVLVATFTIAACSSASSTGAAGSPTGSAPTASSGPTGSNGQTASITGLHLFLDEPVFAHGDASSYYPKYASPGAAVYAGGRFYIFHPGSTAAGRAASEGYVSSSDGKSFAAPSPDQPVLTPQQVSAAGIAVTGNVDVYSVVVDGGKWFMFFTVTSGSPFTGSIARATAASADGPWTVDPAPILTPSAEGWDAGGVGFPSVVKTDQGWTMYYLSDSGAMGRAVSTDGATWTRPAGDPSTTNQVLKTSPSGQLSPLTVDAPRVAWTGKSWLMTYHDSDAIKYSTSQDGVKWTPGLPLVDSSAMGKPINYSSLVVQGGTAYLFVECASTDETTNTYLVTWTA